MFTPGHKKMGGRKKGVSAKVTEARVYAARIIEDPLVQAKLLEQAQRGKLHPAVMREFMHYYWGRPVETMELTGKDGGPVQVSGMFTSEVIGAATQAKGKGKLKQAADGNGGNGRKT